MITVRVLVKGYKYYKYLVIPDGPESNKYCFKDMFFSQLRIGKFTILDYDEIKYDDNDYRDKDCDGTYYTCDLDTFEWWESFLSSKPKFVHRNIFFIATLITVIFSFFNCILYIYFTGSCLFFK